MRKKLDTRFPAARIKKIMQTDEDIGKIAMAVPLLVSKALELFLQDLCRRTYEITLQRGAKTVSSLHLKQCVQRVNMFDFLREIVGKVPDLGGGDTGVDDRSIAKRRKVADNEETDSDEDVKKSRPQEVGHLTGSGRGRGRGRPRGRGRGSRTIEREAGAQCKSEVPQDRTNLSIKDKQKQVSQGLEASNTEDVKVDSGIAKNPEQSVCGFDLNMDLDEAGNSLPTPANSSSAVDTGLKHVEYPGWSLSDVEKMAIDPFQLTHLNQRLDEDDEDYDDEG